MDVAVVGGGLVGMATALSLVRRGLDVTVYERDRDLGGHQSGNNSNVIHSGAFYVPGSLKARLAVSGREMLEDYVTAHGLPLARPGKLVVQQRGEDARFNELARRAGANGVAHEVLDSSEQIAERAPGVTGERALWLPDVAITEFRAVLESLADDVRTLGGTVSLNGAGRFIGSRFAGKDRYVEPRHVIVAAGTGLGGLYPHGDWRIVGFRGSYRALRAPAIEPLVYGVPDPRYPFLGVHLTPTLDGRVLVGPNASMNLPMPLGRSMLAGLRNLRAGLREWRSGRRPASMQRVLRRYVPDAEIAPEIVRSGVRAQAVDRWGRFADDFVLREEPGITWVLNAPSPAATACLSIGEHLADGVVAKLAESPA